MEILIKRVYKGVNNDYTVGQLFIDGIYFCDTLEQTDRYLTQDMDETTITTLTTKDKTAIPLGTYNVVLTKNKLRHDRSYYVDTISVKDVKGFESVALIYGFSLEATNGSILVGDYQLRGKLLNVKIVYKMLKEKVRCAINDRKESVTLTIANDNLAYSEYGEIDYYSRFFGRYYRVNYKSSWLMKR